LVVGTGAGRVFPLLDRDLIDGRGLGRLLAQRPEGPEAGGRGQRGEAIAGAADRQMEGALPAADGRRWGGRPGARAPPRGGGYSGHVRELLESLRTRPAGCSPTRAGHFHFEATIAPKGTPVYHNSADAIKPKTAKNR